MNVENIPEPKFKRGDFVFSGINSHAMKIINSCYDEHWRYQIFDDVNEYWFFEKELKKVEIGDVVYSEVWKEKVIVREFCGDKFILVVDFNGKLLKSLPSLIKQIKDETKLEPKFNLGDKITNGKVTLTILTLMSDKYVVEDNFGECGTLYFNTCDDWKLVEEEPIDCKKCGLTRMSTRCLFMDNCPHNQPKHTIEIPKGWIPKDENGNIINAQKIVLEKKKKEYPKTYEECCKVLGYDDRETYCVCHTYANERLFESLYRLKVCRDAYWKIAGEAMGLNGPWEPDYKNPDIDLYVIINIYNRVEKAKYGYGFQHCVLTFPTEEMRDTFYENFKELIEQCKELL